MLKKAAIGTAAVATGLLVSSPMAFAQDAPHRLEHLLLQPVQRHDHPDAHRREQLPRPGDFNSNNTTVNRSRTVIQRSFNQFRFRN